MNIYKYKYEKHNQELVKYEMNSIFCEKVDDEIILTDQDINPNRSYYINYKIEIFASCNKIEELVTQIANLKLDYDQFKIEFIDVKSDVLNYNSRIDYCKQIAELISGFGVMKDPKITLVVTNVYGVWYFGKLIRNDRSFEKYQMKPHTYSHSLSTELARTLINILCKQNNPTIIDPCCGIGTVIIEALSLGYDIEGAEINWQIANKAKENLDYFGYKNVISCIDMHQIDKKYNVSILDIPYGLMSQTNPVLQTALINKCYEISDELLLVANEDCTLLLANTNWKVNKIINVPKANFMFNRYVYLLEK